MRIAEIPLFLNYNYEPRRNLAHLALQNMESFQPKLLFLHRLLPENREPMNGDAASYESG